MPDSFELPRMLRPVIPLMGSERPAGFRGCVVSKLVAVSFGRTRNGLFTGRRSWLMPGLAAIVGALNDLPEPSAGLRREDAIRISGRSLHVVNLPSSEM